MSGTAVTFEVTTIADAVRKASAIAPTRGAAFDKAAGIVISVWPPDMTQNFPGVCTIRATNNDVFYTEWVNFEEASGQPAVWRLPSQLMAGILGGLPPSSKKPVKMEQVGNRVVVTCARTKAQINLMDHQYYPEWEQFDSSLVRAVPGLGSRLKQVQWAVSRGSDVPLTGIHFDGERIIATDRYSLVTVPCETETIYKPITVPAAFVTPILKDESDCHIGISEDMLLMMPDQSTQIKCVIFGHEYPRVSRAMKRDHPNYVKFNKLHFNDAVQRMLNLVKGDRTPLLKMFFGNGELLMHVADSEVGEMEEVLELPGQAAHPEHEILMSPERIAKAIMASPTDLVSLHYVPGDPKAFVRIEGGDSFEAWVAPRVGVEGKKES